LVQVRRAMYTTSLERWKAYKDFLTPLLRPLRDIILEYEAEAGLPSSAELLSQVGDHKQPEEMGWWGWHLVWQVWVFTKSGVDSG
jgi:hypothetical protein